MLDSKNISIIDDGSNWLIKLGLFLTFCVLIDYLGILYFLEIGSTKL